MLWLRVKIWILLLLCSNGLLFSQVGQTYFSANPANLYEWRSGLVNPSIGAYQTKAVEVGFKLLHLGFADANAAQFKATYLRLNLPRQLPAQLALGLNSRLFTTPIFQEMSFQINLARQFPAKFAVGLSLGLLGISYDRSNFDLVDPDDPVFAGGTSRLQPDVGVGVTLLALRPLVIGFSANHLNRPIISLVDDNLRLEPTFSLGVALHLNTVTVQSSGSRGNNDNLSTGSIQIFDPIKGFLLGGVDQNSFYLRSRLHVKGGISVGYGFSYPLGEFSGTSSGSHEAILVYEFNRQYPLPRLDVPAPEWGEFKPDIPRVDLTPQYFSLASTEKVTIYEKRLHRHFQEDLTPEILARLDDIDLGTLDSAFVDEIFPMLTDVATVTDSLSEMDTLTFSPEYQRALQKLRKELPHLSQDVLLITPETQKRRALLLKALLEESYYDTTEKITILQTTAFPGAQKKPHKPKLSLSDIANSEKIIYFRPERVIFNVYSLVAEQAPTPWFLVVENQDGVEVWRTRGDMKEQQIPWNWRDHQGQIIEPGFYRYYVTWQDEWGQERRSLAHTLYVRKFIREIHLKITTHFQNPGEDIDKIGIILNK